MVLPITDNTYLPVAGLNSPSWKILLFTYNFINNRKNLTLVFYADTCEVSQIYKDKSGVQKKAVGINRIKSRFIFLNA